LSPTLNHLLKFLVLRLLAAGGILGQGLGPHSELLPLHDSHACGPQRLLLPADFLVQSAALLLDIGSLDREVALAVQDQAVQLRHPVRDAIALRGRGKYTLRRCVRPGWLLPNAELKQCAGRVFTQLSRELLGVGWKRNAIFALQEGNTGTVFECRQQSSHRRDVLLGNAVLVRFRDPRFAASFLLLSLRIGKRPKLLVQVLKLHADLRKVE